MLDFTLTATFQNSHISDYINTLYYNGFFNISEEPGLSLKKQL